MALRRPDPHNLHTMAKKAAPIIDSDRPCLGCGYNLRGLRSGINCPECGLPSSLQPASDDPLSLMPMRVILTLVRGCWTAAICVMLMILALLVERFGILEAKIAMTALAILSLVWVGAAIWLTPPITIPQGISRGFGPRSRLRTAGRWMQLGWVMATGAAAIEAITTIQTGPLAALLWLAKLSGLFIGLGGLVVLSILLERLAEWARDEDAQKMFNWAMWSWPLAMLLYVPVHFFISSWATGLGRYRLGAGLFVLLWVLAIGTFPYGLLMLAKSVTLSILHNIEYKGRKERQQERDQRFYDQASTRATKTESQPMQARKPSR